MFKLFLTTFYALRARREGRWRLKYEEQQINRCVLWANEDNYGCCEVVNLPVFNENIGDDYYLPYFL